MRFVSYSQSQDLADPVQVLRSSLNLIIRNIFFKSNLNTTTFYMIWTTTPQSFIALGFLKLGHFIRFGSYSQSQDLITFCRPGSSLKILSQFHYQKHFLKIQFKYDQIRCWYVIANVLHNVAEMSFANVQHNVVVTLVKCRLQTFITMLP